MKNERSWGRGRIIRIAIWIVLAILIRVVFLDADGLWVDEGYTAWTAHLPAADHEIARQNDDAPPLYYAIQRMIVPHLPPSEGSLRLLSVIAGLAGVIWLLVCPPVRGLAELPAAFLAVGAYGTYYSRQARSYTLLMLWALILMTATRRVLEGNRRWLPVVAVIEAAALWTHNVAAALVVGANLAWLIGGRRHPRGWIAAQGAAFVLWLPYLVQAFDQLSVHAELNRWIAQIWEQIPIALAPILSLAAFTSGVHLSWLPPVHRWSYEGTGAIVVTVLALAATTVLLLAAFRRSWRRESLFAAGFTLGPLLFLLAISLATTPSYILGRTDAVAYPGFLLWAAIGARAIPRPGRYAVFAILALSTVLATLPHISGSATTQVNDRVVGERLRAEIDDGDWVGFVGLSRPSIDYYLSRGRPGSADDSYNRIPFPASTGANPAAIYPTPTESLAVWEAEAYAVRASFEQAARGTDQALYYVGPISPSATAQPTAADLPYPGNMLAYVLNGLGPLDTILRLPGDRVGTDWILFRVRADRLIPLDELEPIEAAP